MKHRRPEQFDELRDLLNVLVDGSIDPVARARLASLLENDPGAQHYYLQHIYLHTSLIGKYSARMPITMTSESAASNSTTSPAVSPSRRVGRPKRPAKQKAGLTGNGRNRTAICFLAAGLLTVATLWFVSSSPPSRPTPSSHPVAMLTDVRDATFTRSVAPMNLGGDLPMGPIHLESGSAEVMFASGAAVKLIGPSRFELTGSNRGRVTIGTLSAYVPDGAEGFTVDLPGGARLVDLGTAFEVATQHNGDSLVLVREGSVRLDLRTPGDDRWRTARTLGENTTVLLALDEDGAARVSPQRVLIAEHFAAGNQASLAGRPVEYVSPTLDRTPRWRADSNWRADGSKLDPGSANAWLAFDPEPGNVYTLSAEVNVRYNDIGQWIALGFAEHAELEESFYQNNPIGWMLHRRSDDPDKPAISTFDGPGIQGGQKYAMDLQPNAFVLLQIVLDTRNEPWTVQWLADGHHLRGPTALASQSVIRHIGFGAFKDAIGSVDNLRLTMEADAETELSTNSQSPSIDARSEP